MLAPHTRPDAAPYSWTELQMQERLGYAPTRPAPPHIATFIQRASHACGWVITLDGIPPENDLSGTVKQRRVMWVGEADRMLGLLGLPAVPA